MLRKNFGTAAVLCRLDRTEVSRQLSFGHMTQKCCFFLHDLGNRCALSSLRSDWVAVPVAVKRRRVVVMTVVEMGETSSMKSLQDCRHELIACVLASC